MKVRNENIVSMEKGEVTAPALHDLTIISHTSKVVAGVATERVDCHIFGKHHIITSSWHAAAPLHIDCCTF